MLRPNGLDDEPQYQLDIDREKASALGLSIADINNTLAAGWGSAYVNQFIDRGRVKKVFIQGDADSRMLPQDLDRWYVRNGAGTMIPFSAFASAHWTYGSPEARALQRRRLAGVPGRPGAGQEQRRCHEGDGGGSRPSCPRASATTGPAFPTRSGCPARRPRRCMPSR